MDFRADRWVECVSHAAFSPRTSHKVCVGNGYIYLTGGDCEGVSSSEVWRTSDGETWDLLTSTPGWAARANHGCVFLAGKIYIFGGSNASGTFFNDCWSSADGITWNQETAAAGWSIRHQFGYCVHDNKIYLSGGYYSIGGYPYYFYADVWSSTNGINWTLVSTNFGRSIRLHSMASFLGDLWIYGGTDNDAGANADLRRSTDDGATWNLVGYRPGTRFAAKALVNDTGTQLILLGGSGGVSGNDAWVTTNGINFTQITQVVSHAIRFYFDGELFNNTIYLIAGEASNIDRDDVWKEQYRITYNANGGSLAPTDANLYDADDTPAVLGPGSMTRDWYVFNSWNTAYNGSGTTYNPTDAFTFLDSGIATLYAQWDETPTPDTYYVEAGRNNIAPFDTRENASPTFAHLYQTMPEFAWHDGVTIYVFGTIQELDEWEWMEMLDVKIIGEDPQTTIVNLSTNSFEYVSTYNISFIADNSEAEWNTPIYNFREVINCRFEGNDLWYEAIDVYDAGSTVKVLGCSFRNFKADAVYIAIDPGPGWGDFIVANNSFVGNCWIEVYNSEIVHYHYYNNVIRDGESYTEFVSLTITEFFHDHNIATGGFTYIEDAVPFSADVTEITDDPLYLETDPNNMLAIDETSPAYHSGITRSSMPPADLKSIPYATPVPSRGAYEVPVLIYITYNGNGNTSGTVPEPTGFPEGTPATVAYSESLSKIGYYFDHWNTETDDSGTSYDPAEVFTMGADPFTLYAQWLPGSGPVLQWMIPTCSITSPLPTDVFFEPADITVEVDATTPVGTIEFVELYMDSGSGNVLIDTGTTYPYNFPLTAVMSGTYIFTARAVNSVSGIAFSTPIAVTVGAYVPVPPVCNILSPEDGDIFEQPADIDVEVEAYDTDGTITKVEFFLNSIYQGEVLVPPYTFTLEDVMEGSYLITATATDDMGLSTTSNPVVVIVELPNVPPTCIITAPVTSMESATFARLSEVLIKVDAEDSDGYVTKVEFFIDSGSGFEKFGEDLSAPYSAVLYDLEIGDYEVVAIATDDDGASTTSDPIYLHIIDFAEPVKDNIPPITTSDIPVLDLGDIDGTILIAGTVPSGSTTVYINGFTLETGVVKEGARFIIGSSDPTVYTVASDATISSNECNISFAPGLVVQADDGEAIVFLTTKWNRHNQFFVELHAVDYANTEHDTPSGVYRTFYTLDGSEPTLISSYGPNQPNDVTRFLVEGQGEIQVNFFSVDNLNNTERMKTDILGLDDIPPETVHVAPDPDGSNGWYQTNPDISLEATDASSGVFRTFYRFDTSPFQEYTYLETFQLPGEGIHTLQYFSEDNAGNVEDVKTVFFKYDTHPPYTQDDALPGLHREIVTVYFYTSDLSSGVEKTYYTLDGTVPTIDSESGSSVVLSESGSYTINYFSVDFAGNIEEMRTCHVDVFIDTDPPGTYIYESFHIDGENGWYKNSPEITIAAVDPSGIKEIQYKLHPVGQETTAKYTSTVDISGSVDLSINHYIKIEIDQSEDPYEISLRGTIPTQTTITEIINTINGVVGQEIATETGADGQEGNGYVTLTSPTAGTGVSTAEIKFLQVLSNDATEMIFGLDETSYPHTFTETVVFIPFTAPFEIPFDEYWNIEYYSVDNQDNQSETASKRYKLDSESPVSSVVNSFEPDGENGWYVSNPQIQIVVTDNLSGIYKTYYQWDGEPWLEYTGTVFNIPGEGARILKVYSIDLAGNEEIEKVFEYNFDQSTPVTTDDTIKYQGIIYTSRGSGHQEIAEENPVIIGPYTVRTRNLNVVATPRIYNVTKSQEYVLSEITGADRNELVLLSLNRNEDASRLDGWNIQLVGLGSSLLPSLNNVLRVYDRTNGLTYSVDHDLSSLDGNLFLKGDRPIAFGDVLAVDYSYPGVPLSSSDIIDLNYAFDNSHDPQPISTPNYTLVESANQPYIIDYDVTISLTPTDAFSTVLSTYYTIDGSEPTTSSTQGTQIYLTEPGTYIIKYFSVDIAGNAESVKTALYNIVIDKRIPALEMIFVPPADGYYGWHKNNFGIDINLWSEDFVDRHDEDAVIAEQHLVELGINDAIDFEETSGVELTAIITPGLYTSVELAQAIEDNLNVAGSSVYVVTLLDDTVSEGQRFSIESDLTGGAGIFNLLWSTGSNASQSLAKTIGFGSSNPEYPTEDSTGSGTYSSLYCKFRLNNYFVKSVEQITIIERDLTVPITETSRQTPIYRDLSCVEVLPGIEGFFDEILVYSSEPLPSVQNVTQVLEVTAGVGGRDYDYLWDKPVEGTLVVTKDSVPLTIDVDYEFDATTDKVTIYVVDSSLFEASYSLKDKVLVDYTHYIGLEDVRFGLDTTNLTIIEPIYGEPERFVDLSNDRANFIVTFPAISSQFYLQEGRHVIYAKAYDHNTVLGTGVPQKQSTLYELPFKLDRIAPTTTNSSVGTEWLKAPITIYFIATDNPQGSGIETTYYTIDGSIPTTSSLSGSEVTFDFSGTFTLRYFSADVAGNLEAVNSLPDPIRVDADPPLTAIYTTPTIPDGNNWWFVSQPTVGFTVVDHYSGPAQTFYKIDDDIAFTEYTGPFLLPKEGAVTITYYSIDNAGNIENEKIAIVKYDATAPVTTTDAPVSGYSSNPIVTFLVEDEASGLQTTYYTTDGSDPDFSSLTGSFVEFSASGTYTLKFFSVDRAGNVETIRTQTINIDLEAPVVSDFLPENCIITDLTTEISFKVSDSLSGVDIDSIIVDVDGVIYSTEKNSSYFSYSGTPAEYSIIISPISGVLNFEDIEVLRIKNTKDFAGNTATVLEFNFVSPDVLAPWVREVYPAPNMQDVSTNTNVITYIDDAQSGVDIKSVVVSINTIDFKINSKSILSIQYTGTATTAICQIYNKSLTTTIDSIQDISISFYEPSYNTIKKIEQYLNSLSDYTAIILDARFEQKESTLLLNVSNLNITQPKNLDLYPPEENLNFSFIERGRGYLVFASPDFSFEHKSTVTVDISASDYSGNVMEIYSYVFIPHIYATPSIKKRNYLNRVALQYLADIQDNIASNYTRSRSTHFYGHQKAICLELARHLEEIDHLNEDRSYGTLRPLYLYEKLGYLLDTKPSVDLSHDDYRRLLQSLIGILFKGSLKTSLETGVGLYLGSEVNIVEVVFSSGSDISEQFVFTADIIINDEQFVGIDLISLSNNLSHLFNLVKPAHVYYIQRFVWSDEFDFQAGCILQWEQVDGEDVIDQFGNRVPLIGDDGFQEAVSQSDTAICDRYKYYFDSTYTEDMRQDCSAKLAMINFYTDDVSPQFSGAEDYFYTYRHPLLKDETHVATELDIVVTVNGIVAQILELNAITGFIRLNITPPYGSVVVVTYKYNEYFIYRIITFYLNDPNSTFGGGREYFNLMTGDPDDFIIDSGESGFQIERLFSATTYEIVGRIQVPDVTPHAHICETLLGNIDLSFSGDPFVGDPFPGSIEEDPSITDPDFPEEIQRIAEFKEPLMLGAVGLSGTSFTYLNDPRYKLNNVSILNNLWKKHDYAFATFLDEIDSLDVSGDV